MTAEDNAADLRKAFGKFATGVTVVTVGCDGAQHGMTANAFTSVSLDPPMLLICVDNKAKTLKAIRDVGQFGVSVLTEHQTELSNHFAGRAEIDGISFCRLNGVPTIAEALARFACFLEGAHPAGDHTILLGRITAFEHREERPLLFSAGRYHRIGTEPHPVV